MKLFALCAWAVFLGGISTDAKSDSDPNLYLASQEFISVPEAEKKWGKAEFSIEKFRNGSQRERAAMTANLARMKNLLGKTSSEIKNLLGDFSGHFWGDSVPTYLIEEGWPTGGNTWQLVFLLDDDGKVNEIKIHKNCCGEKRK